ncbi:hypothetical protein NXX58_07070 [Phocaeicola vulgatus]|uniref:hypothetical protein n=1 Tax=Phocaeicola vulgatus TaxID=821 RepID=UPI00216604C2|nr:hypothetical protein [Phocaeicola vulgatus]MCS2904207.1 hypothetical protein [Phocaeicola vulgatus]
MNAGTHQARDRNPFPQHIPRRQPLHESISYPNVSPTHEAATEPIRHPDLQRQWDSIGAAPYRHSPEPIRNPQSTVRACIVPL